MSLLRNLAARQRSTNGWCCPQLQPDYNPSHQASTSICRRGSQCIRRRMILTAALAAVPQYVSALCIPAAVREQQGGATQCKAVLVLTRQACAVPASSHCGEIHCCFIAGAPLAHPLCYINIYLLRRRGCLLRRGWAGARRGETRVEAARGRKEPGRGSHPRGRHAWWWHHAGPRGEHAGWRHAGPGEAPRWAAGRGRSAHGRWAEPGRGSSRRRGGAGRTGAAGGWGAAGRRPHDRGALHLRPW
mmetsp:Transcript_10320/g.31056  ORF Transcript_10320/g.31056 Transcript_10320/m.31056 type:complete len:245 (+) Transcript_10320:348-1082(+)